MYRFAKYFLLVEREQDLARYVVLNLIGVDEERQSLPRVLWWILHSIHHMLQFAIDTWGTASHFYGNHKNLTQTKLCSRLVYMMAVLWRMQMLPTSLWSMVGCKASPRDMGRRAAKTACLRMRGTAASCCTAGQWRIQSAWVGESRSEWRPWFREVSRKVTSEGGGEARWRDKCTNCF